MRFRTANNLRRTLGAAVGALLITLALPTSPAAAADLSRWNPVSNYNSGKCLEVGGWSTANGAGVNQWSCHGGNNQLWMGVPYGSGQLIYNGNSGKCLEVQGWSTANGAAIGQWDCHGGANQQWKVVEVGDNEQSAFLVNVNSGKCLEIGGWSKDNGAPVTQWDCHWGKNQRWY
ncbi:RICIN domain-containing protein [Streptomyces sp. NBC_00249]|uniref:RICIN domain-containing protein n=1 Tax=Streptomyces sp. NBC_00249 TaxID=2975690 RepID=UPI00225A1551|nr:RICIN domain-containing protein [Streptomyces sp. NBC_00249]MCX5192372.1 RICIN domain-containing protein [Streptomyces sp. NBC_00249]